MITNIEGDFAVTSAEIGLEEVIRKALHLTGVGSKQRRDTLEFAMAGVRAVLALERARGAEASMTALTPLEQEMLEALKGLLAYAPTPKGIKNDFSYILYLEAARKAVAKAQ